MKNQLLHKSVVFKAFRSARIGLERPLHDHERLAKPAKISRLGLSVAREEHPDNRDGATEPNSDLSPG